MKVSNIFTTIRLAFAPIFFILYNIPLWTGNAFFYKISSFILIPFLLLVEFTDYLDGHYARKLKEVSDYGKLFDPFADVVLNLTIFFCLSSSVSGRAFIPNFIFIFILYRELGMLFIRMNALKKGVTIAAKWPGKVKTVFYIIAGLYSLVLESIMRLGVEYSFIANLEVFYIISYSLFIICLILSYLSFILYIKDFIKISSK